MQSNGQRERPTNGEPHDEPQAYQRLTVAQAAASLGITEGAVRSRIKRGTLPTVKEGGSVYVVLVDGTPPTDQPPHTDEPTGEPFDQPQTSELLVESLREQVEYLRGQLDQEREAGRRKDHLLAAALERIPAIESPEDAPAPPDSPVRGAEEADRGQTPQQDPPASEGRTTPRSWWRRFFGFE